MKKVFLISILLLMVCSITYGQVSFGIRGGVSYNKTYEKPQGFWGFPDTTYVGFHIGVYSSFKLNKRLSLNPELQYIKKGITKDYYVYNYLELPVLLDYSVLNKIHLQAGPAIGGELSLYQEKDLAIGISDWELDVSWIVGLKFNATERLAILSRYNQSLLPIIEIYCGPTGEDRCRAYLRNVQLSVQYRLNKKTV